MGATCTVVLKTRIANDWKSPTHPLCPIRDFKTVACWPLRNHSKPCQVARKWTFMNHKWFNIGDQQKGILHKTKLAQCVQDREGLQLSGFRCIGKVLSIVNMHLTWWAVPQSLWCTICKKRKYKIKTYLNTVKMLRKWEHSLNVFKCFFFHATCQLWTFGEKGKKLIVAWEFIAFLLQILYDFKQLQLFSGSVYKCGL